MKISVKVFAIFSLLFCFACGAKRSTQSKLEKTQQEMINESTDTSESNTSSDDSAGNDMDSDVSNSDAAKDNRIAGSGVKEQSSTATPSQPSEINDTSGSSQMYEQLKMTDEQVKNFENSVENFEMRQKNMANGEMLGTVDNEKERILEEILSPGQFSSYQIWKKDN